MMITRAPLSQTRRWFICCCALLLLSCWLASSAAAQSTDIEFPTPIRSSEISGVIMPRDVGDPRLTRYFYSLLSANGDLTVTVESNNLNGDVDLFAVSGLRPLTKLSMFAGDTAGSTSKTIYFKREESLILRVEARTPNDSEGTFRIRFTGAFAPIVGEVREAEPVVSPTTQPETTGRKTKRVTATGARIDEPVVETATAPAPEPTMTPAPEVATAEPKPETTSSTETPTEPEPAPRPARPTRTRRPRPPARRSRPRPQPPATAENTQPTPTEQPTATTPEPVPAGPRLIIETRDGLRVERYMANVRRVTIDNGQIVVFLKNGKTERQPMTNVLKMSIEP